MTTPDEVARRGNVVGSVLRAALTVITATACQPCVVFGKGLERGAYSGSG